VAADESTRCLRRARVEESNPIVKSQEIRSAHSIGSGIDSGSIDRNAHSMIARQAVDVLVKK